jgi:hypothetical protein
MNLSKFLSQDELVLIFALIFIFVSTGFGAVPLIVFFVLYRFNFITKIITMEYSWLALVLIQGYFVAIYWSQTNNHDYLFFYFCLLNYLRFAIQIESSQFRRAAGLLIGLVFAIAAIQKLKSHEFFTGLVLEKTILVDSRVNKIFRQGLGLNDNMFQTNLHAENIESNHIKRENILLSNETIKSLSKIATVWTLVLEFTIGILFLINSKAKDVFLPIFLVTTYPVLPVFGFLLVLLAIAISQAQSKKTVVYYLLSAVFLFPTMTVLGIL